MKQETIYYQSPAGILKISGENDWLTEIFFACTEKNGIKEEDITVFSTPALPVLQKTIQQLEEYFAGNRMEFDIPMNQKGTHFQKRVWEGLMNIKAGTTISYLTFSKRLGDVKAIRAVGTANGRNNISIIVPCHRVIGSDGSLVGYGGDKWRKKWLLEHEARYTNGVQSLFSEDNFVHSKEAGTGGTLLKV